jgi:hypothetical protein
MAAGLGFKDFVTGEVLTAADVDGYLMQGIWVFASATARDAAVTSPQEGNFAFLKDTNTTTYYTGSAWTNLDTTGMVNPMTTTGDTIYSSSGSTPARLGIGTAGQVLQVNSGATAPEWATPAGGGGMTLLSTTSLSGASVTVSSINQTYKHLFVVVKDAYAASDTDLRLRFNGDTGSNYYNRWIFSSGTTISLGDGQETTIKAGVLGASSNYDKTTDLVFTIVRYAETEYKTIPFTSSAKGGSANTAAVFTGHMRYNSTTAISSITLLTGGANYSAGTIYIYGVS